MIFHRLISLFVFLSQAVIVNFEFDTEYFILFNITIGTVNGGVGGANYALFLKARFRFIFIQHVDELQVYFCASLNSMLNCTTF